MPLRRAIHCEQRFWRFREGAVGFELKVGREDCPGEKLAAATKDRARQTEAWKRSENASLAFLAVNSVKWGRKIYKRRTL